MVLHFVEHELNTLLAVPRCWAFVTWSTVKFVVRKSKSRLESCLSLAIGLGLVSEKPQQNKTSCPSCVSSLNEAFWIFSSACHCYCLVAMIHYLVMQSAVEYEKIGAEMLCNLQMFLQLMFIILQGVTIDVFVVI